MTIAGFDDELFQAIEEERKRQEDHIELIASENYTSPRVMEAQGSQLTNKYAEGYPGKRYYGGCEYVDKAEQLAIDRAKELFDADYANVQPHSGSQANQAVYFAMLKPGDTIMGMNLGHGGHLTHGSPANLSGKLFNIGSRYASVLLSSQPLREVKYKDVPSRDITGAYSGVDLFTLFPMFFTMAGLGFSIKFSATSHCFKFSLANSITEDCFALNSMNLL